MFEKTRGFEKEGLGEKMKTGCYLTTWAIEGTIHSSDFFDILPCFYNYVATL